MSQPLRKPVEETDYERIERVLRFVEDHYPERPSLAELAAEADLSEHHFHRLFSRWAGTTPKRFLQCLTVEDAKQRLHRSQTVLDAAFDTGLSSPGRLHDLMVTVEAVSPGEFRSGGAGLVIRWGVHDTPFGDALVAVTDRGVCAFEFLTGRDADAAVAELAAAWPGAELAAAPETSGEVVRRIFPAPRRLPEGPFHLLVRGTNFQLQVWRALLRLPVGTLTTYGDIARRLGRPTAARAVGGAVGANPVSYLIPCHRVINSLGTLGNYRWDPARKQALLGWEAAVTAPRSAAVG